MLFGKNILLSIFMLVLNICITWNVQMFTVQCFFFTLINVLIIKLKKLFEVKSLPGLKKLYQLITAKSTVLIEILLIIPTSEKISSLNFDLKFKLIFKRKITGKL